MALFGLFGKKNNGTEQKGEYFLDADDAKTYGDIDFMRTPAKVKHTFPKNTRNGGAFEVVTEVSSMDLKEASQAQKAAQAEETASFNVTPSSSTQRRKTSSDSSMDTFRQMAKQMRR